jgi:hypothetical protein
LTSGFTDSKCENSRKSHISQHTAANEKLKKSLGAYVDESARGRNSKRNAHSGTSHDALKKLKIPL